MEMTREQHVQWLEQAARNWRGRMDLDKAERDATADRYSAIAAMLKGPVHRFATGLQPCKACSAPALVVLNLSLGGGYSVGTDFDHAPECPELRCPHGVLWELTCDTCEDEAQWSAEAFCPRCNEPVSDSSDTDFAVGTTETDCAECDALVVVTRRESDLKLSTAWKTRPEASK